MFIFPLLSEEGQILWDPAVTDVCYGNPQRAGRAADEKATKWPSLLKSFVLCSPKTRQEMAYCLDTCLQMALMLWVGVRSDPGSEFTAGGLGSSLKHWRRRESWLCE